MRLSLIISQCFLVSYDKIRVFRSVFVFLQYSSLLEFYWTDGKLLAKMEGGLLTEERPHQVVGGVTA